MGDAGTSVIALFGVAGKPVYILNNDFSEKPAADDWKASVCGTVRSDRLDRYSLIFGNRIFEKNSSDNTYHYLCSLPNEYSGGGYYDSVIREAGKVLIFPVNAENILIMEPEKNTFHTVEIKHKVGRMGAFGGSANFIFSEHPEIFYLLPNRYPSLVRFDAAKEKVSYIEDEAFSDEYSVYENDVMERILGVRFFYNDYGLVPAVKDTEKFPNITGRSSKTVTAPDDTVHTMHEISLPRG